MLLAQLTMATWHVETQIYTSCPNKPCSLQGGKGSDLEWTFCLNSGLAELNVLWQNILL